MRARRPIPVSYTHLDVYKRQTYGDVTYPAGEYDALRIKLGAAEGQNWWCVMFPPLCLVNTEDTAGSQEVEYDSAILEWLRGLFGGDQG